MNKLITVFALLTAVTMAIPMNGSALLIVKDAPDIWLGGPPTQAELELCLAAVENGAYLGEADGELLPPERDHYCVFTSSGTISFTADTVSAATAVDLYGCVSDLAFTIGSCGDDNFACSFPPASGYSCPSTSWTTSPGSLVMVTVARFDWTLWFGEPVVGGYHATFMDGDVPAVGILL